MSASFSIKNTDIVTTANSWTQSLPEKETVQRGLLVATTATAILASIPPFRAAGSLAVRTIAFLSSGLNCVGADSKSSLLASIGKCAVVALGIAAVAFSRPVLFTASLVADIGLQVFQMAKHIYDGENCKAALNLSIIVVDAFALAAVATGSWPFMVTAAAISTCVMFGFFLNALGSEANSLDTACYGILAGLGLVNTIAAAKFTKTKPETSKFTVKNDQDPKGTMSLFDKNGKLITTLEPWESKEVVVPYNDTIVKIKVVVYPNPNGPQLIAVPLGSYIKAETPAIYLAERADEFNRFEIKANAVDYKTVVVQEPIAVENYPTLPLVGTTYMTPEGSAYGNDIYTRGFYSSSRCD